MYIIKLAMILALHFGQRTHSILSRFSLLCFGKEHIKWPKISSEKRVMQTPIYMIHVCVKLDDSDLIKIGECKTTLSCLLRVSARLTISGSIHK